MKTTEKVLFLFNACSLVKAEDDETDKGKIISIVVVVLVILVISAVAIWFYCKRRYNENNEIVLSSLNTQNQQSYDYDYVGSDGTVGNASFRPRESVVYDEVDEQEHLQKRGIASQVSTIGYIHVIPDDNTSTVPTTKPRVPSINEVEYDDVFNDNQQLDLGTRRGQKTETIINRPYVNTKKDNDFQQTETKDRQPREHNKPKSTPPKVTSKAKSTSPHRIPDRILNTSPRPHYEDNVNGDRVSYDDVFVKERDTSSIPTRPLATPSSSHPTSTQEVTVPHDDEIELYENWNDMKKVFR